MNDVFTDDQLAKLREWEGILRDLSQFVVVAQIKGLKFVIHTNEKGRHHRPHLHVDSHSGSMAIAIDDATILAHSGKLLPAQIRRAQAWVRENKGLLVEKWNLFSNGIEIEVA